MTFRDKAFAALQHEWPGTPIREQFLDALEQCIDPETPDAFDPSLECGAWRKAPRVIGGTAHSHVCRLPADHDGSHRCHSGDRHQW